jgi:pilus assembly protein TadC
VTGDRAWTALLLLATALLTWSPADARAASRVRALAGRTRAVRPSGRPLGRRPGARRAQAGVAGVAVALLLGGLPGLVAGALVAVAAERLLRSARGADEERQRREAVDAELPFACDLLAVVLGAGVPVGGALAAVAGVVRQPLAGILDRVARLYALGAEPRRAWAEVPDQLTPLARALVRAGDQGAPVAAALGSLAADARAARRGRVESDVRRAGVWVLAPLGLCFLPAFVCLGVVPLVLGIAGQVFR